MTQEAYFAYLKKLPGRGLEDSKGSFERERPGTAEMVNDSGSAILLHEILASIPDTR